MQKWNQIAYVANNEEARKLLALLIENDNEELTYNIITSKGISRPVINLKWLKQVNLLLMDIPKNTYY